MKKNALKFDGDLVGYAVAVWISSWHKPKPKKRPKRPAKQRRRGKA